MWWLGWVALVPVFLAIRYFRPLGSALVCGFWGGSLCLASYLLDSFGFKQTPWSFALLIGIPALYGYFASALTLRKSYNPFLLGLGWALMELALQPVALHNGLLAGTQGNNVWIGLVGRTGGYVLVAFLVAYANAALLLALASVGRATGGQRLFVHVSRERIVPIAEEPLLSWRFLKPVRPRPPPLVIA